MKDESSFVENPMIEVMAYLVNSSILLSYFPFLLWPTKMLSEI